jgi:hypothetical protein
MRKSVEFHRRMAIVLVSICFFLLPVSVLAGLKVEPMTHDFGSVEEGTVARVQFVVQNTGDQDATIKNVRTN